MGVKKWLKKPLGYAKSEITYGLKKRRDYKKEYRLAESKEIVIRARKAAKIKSNRQLDALKRGPASASKKLDTIMGFGGGGEKPDLYDVIGYRPPKKKRR